MSPFSKHTDRRIVVGALAAMPALPSLFGLFGSTAQAGNVYLTIPRFRQ